MIIMIGADHNYLNNQRSLMKTEISPISDAKGTKEYKTLLLGQLIKAHLGERGSL